MNLFQSLVPQAITDNLMKAKWNSDLIRQEEAEDRLSLYSDDYEEIIRDALSKLFCQKNFERMYYHVNGSQNMIKRVINQISTVYKVPAQRTLDIESPRYEDIKLETTIDVRMKKVNRLTNLMNEMLVIVAIRDGKIVLDTINPSNCMVIQNEDDPTKMDGFMYMRTLQNTPDSTLVEYPYWHLSGEYGVLDEDFRPKVMTYTPDDYPYRDAQGRFVLPAIAVHRQHPEDSFWDQHSGRDLYNAGISMGVKMTLFDYLFKTNTIKQIYVIGANVDLPDKQVMDPQSVIKGNISPDGNAQIGVLDMQLNLDQMIQSLTFQLNSVINNYGISADMWSLSISEMSGRALKIRNQALLESREEQEETYRQAESDLFNVMRIVNNAHASYFGWQKIPEDATFAVDFGEIDFPEDPNYEIDLEAKRLKSGLISLGQFYMKFNPDIEDEKAAEKAILENLNKLKATRDANPTLDEALNFIMKGNPEKPGTTGVEGNPEDKALAESTRGNA